MDLTKKIQKELESKYGEFETTLESQYKDKFIDNLINGKGKDRLFWTTYHQVILELRNNLCNDLKLKELMYYLTEGDDVMCLKILESIDVKNKEIDRLYLKIKEF
jgi:hypothetical protein